MFNKIFLSTFFGLNMGLIFFYSFDSFKKLSIFYFFMLLDSSFYFESFFSLDFVSIIFLIMVLSVTSIVLLYSQFYMDSYNNFKFIFLTLTFFSFMIILILGGDILIFMIGWDGLGLSSLFLIMYYPNKTTIYNSYMTLFFNRLGDAFLLFFFCSLFMNFFSCFYLSTSLSGLMNLILFLCLLTKSAQIPFSSWLPAAMSAPTPISAMVHSSTLVTAGILIFFKTSSYFMNSSLFFYLTLISLSTFIVGGFLGLIEKDLKKVVAFSTMSQISMIIFFISTNFLFFGMSHTFFHALFKTLLFCACGILFMNNNSDQIMKSFFGLKDSMIIIILFIVSIYSMSGMIYSSSFFTKGLILESFLTEKDLFLFIILFTGSIFTLIYSGSIFKSLSSFFKNNSIFKMFKLNNFFFLGLFFILNLFCSDFLKEVLNNNFSFILPWYFVILINLTIFLSIIFFFFIFNKKFFYLSLSVFTFKENFFSILDSPLKNMFLKIYMSDLYIFKYSNLMKISSMKLTDFVMKDMIYTIFLFTTLMIFCLF